MSNPEELPDYDEASVSQIPALIQLYNPGYTYLRARRFLFTTAALESPAGEDGEGDFVSA